MYELFSLSFIISIMDKVCVPLFAISSSTIGQIHGPFSLVCSTCWHICIIHFSVLLWFWFCYPELALMRVIQHAFVGLGIYDSLLTLCLLVLLVPGLVLWDLVTGILYHCVSVHHRVVAPFSYFVYSQWCHYILFLQSVQLF